MKQNGIMVRLQWGSWRTVLGEVNSMKIVVLDPGKKVSGIKTTRVTTACCGCSICGDFAVSVRK